MDSRGGSATGITGGRGMAARPTDFTALAADGAYDVIVLGAGAAGFSAAVTAALLKQKVLLVERTEYVGGTTAFSVDSDDVSTFGQGEI